MSSLQAVVGATWCLTQYALLRGKIVVDTPEKQRSLHWLDLLMAYTAAVDPHVFQSLSGAP